MSESNRHYVPSRHDMMGRMSPAAPAWQNRSDGSVWVIGMKVETDHIARLHGVRYLTLYDARVQPGVLSQLPDLELLDLRTTAVDAVAEIGVLTRLRGLALAHNRNVIDLSSLAGLEALELLELYGLSKVTALPKLNSVRRLKRLNLGQMIRLTDWRPLADAPSLETLELQNKLSPDLEVLSLLARENTFRYFSWSAPDESRRRVEAAESAAGRPSPPSYVRIGDLWEAMS